MQLLARTLVLVLGGVACERRPEAAQGAVKPVVAGTGMPAGETRALRPSFDFIANRVHALAYREGRLVIPAGEPDFLKFVDGGWKTSWILGQKLAGRKVAYVAGLQATLFVPLDQDADGPLAAPGDPTLRITLTANAPRQRMSVFTNEQPIGSLDVGGETAAAHDMVVPRALLRLGENRFRLNFRAAGAVPGGKRGAAAIERCELRPPSAGERAGGGSGLEVAEVDLAGVRKRAMVLPAAARVSFHVQPPREARLGFSYGAPPGVAPGRAIVRVASDGRRPLAVLFDRSAPAGRWAQAVLDLSPYGTQAVRVDFVARGGGVSFGAPRLLVPARPAAAHEPRKLDRLFVWMVDTLRADKVRVYNSKTIVETPHYDAFARDSTRFVWAHVPGTWSLPSHASILTGVYPTVHRAVAHEARLSREVAFVAELLRQGGYRTALFSSNGYVSGKWGFDRGWDHSRNFIRESLPNGADYLWKNAKSWILANGAQPQFVYLATVEPHVSYNPKQEFLEKYWHKPYRGPIKPVLTGIQLGRIKAGTLKIDDTDRAYLEALHNAEITQSDAAFGAFVADLKAAGLYDTSAVIVVSDHGDEFWEHGNVGHAQSVHQELVHIPLMIRAPGVFQPGALVEADVEAMDLFPTLLDLAGLAPPDGTQGDSLVALARDEASASPRAALSQNIAVSRGVKVGRYRLINGGPARLELYDEIADPREQKNLAGERPIALRYMRNVLGLLVGLENRWQKRAWGTAANLHEAFYAAKPW